MTVPRALAPVYFKLLIEPIYPWQAADMNLNITK